MPKTTVVPVACRLSLSTDCPPLQTMMFAKEKHTQSADDHRKISHCAKTPMPSVLESSVMGMLLNSREAML